MTFAGHPDSKPARQPAVAGELLDAEQRPSRAKAWSNKDEAQFAKLLSYWTDSVFEVPGLGWRFGLDPLIGLVPIVGDLASGVVSLYIISLAAHHGVSRSTMLRMALNVGIDYALGSVPLIGNLFDFAWKANQRNMALLETSLAAGPSERRRQTIWDWVIIGGLMLLLVAAFIGSIALAILLANWMVAAFQSAG
jgi:hypothetical protein